MSKKQHIGFIILAVVIFGGLFYWYSLRPSIIKQNCYKEAREKTMEAKSDKVEVYNFVYKICLQRKGL